VLAISPHLHIARSRLAQAIDRDLGEAALGELEGDEVNRIGPPFPLEPARVTSVDRQRLLTVERYQQIDEVHAAFEERPVRHRRTPGHRLVPRCEIHQLPDLAKDEASDVPRPYLLAQRSVDRHLTELVVDGYTATRRLGSRYHTIRISHVRDEWLLADDMCTPAQRIHAEGRVRARRCCYYDELCAALIDQLLQRPEGAQPGLALPRFSLVGGAVGAAHDVDSIQLPERRFMKASGRPAQPDDTAPHGDG